MLIGAPEERWVVASAAGYGFVVPLAELHSRNKAGKAARVIAKMNSLLEPDVIEALYEASQAGVNVELVWDPPWNQGMMTEAARLQLGLM